MQHTLQHIFTNITPIENSTDRLHLSYKLYHTVKTQLLYPVPCSYIHPLYTMLHIHKSCPIYHTCTKQFSASV
jgi:hypothetical protein